MDGTWRPAEQVSDQVVELHWFDLGGGRANRGSQPWRGRFRDPGDSDRYATFFGTDGSQALVLLLMDLQHYGYLIAQLA